MDNKIIVGILAIIFGLIVMIFPFLGQFVLSIIAGIVILILGIYFIDAGANMWSFSKAGSIIYVIIGFFGMLAGIMLVGNILLFELLVGFYLYITGIMMLIAGLVGILTRSTMMSKASAALMFILGILCVVGIIMIILGYLTLLNPMYVSLIIGISLIIDGIAFAIGTDNEIEIDNEKDTDNEISEK